MRVLVLVLVLVLLLLLVLVIEYSLITPSRSRRCASRPMDPASEGGPNPILFDSLAATGRATNGSSPARSRKGSGSSHFFFDDDDEHRCAEHEQKNEQKNEQKHEHEHEHEWRWNQTKFRYLKGQGVG